MITARQAATTPGRAGPVRPSRPSGPGPGGVSAILPPGPGKPGTVRSSPRMASCCGWLALEQCERCSLRVREHREATGTWDVSRAGDHGGAQVGRLLDVGIDISRAEVDEPVVGHVGGQVGTPGHEPADGAATYL